jgi:AcrR family transcriptional regulator
MPKLTQEHIANKALHLFNTNGVSNVRLQHMADAAFVSVGHLAYHFKNKESVVAYLYQQFDQEHRDALLAFNAMPLFEHFNQMLEKLFSIKVTYRFFYTDALEVKRSFPDIANRHSQYIMWQKLQLEMMLQFYVSRGAIAMPPHLNASIGQLAELIQMVMDTWLYRNAMLDIAHLESQAFINDVWRVLLPYCTPESLQEIAAMNAVSAP